MAAISGRRIGFNGLLWSCLLFLAIVQACVAATYYVDSINGSDGANGLSPQTAFSSLHKAVSMQTMDSSIILLSPVSLNSSNPLKITSASNVSIRSVSSVSIFPLISCFATGSSSSGSVVPVYACIVVSSSSNVTFHNLAFTGNSTAILVMGSSVFTEGSLFSNFSSTAVVVAGDAQLQITSSNFTDNSCSQISQNLLSCNASDVATFAGSSVFIVQSRFAAPNVLVSTVPPLWIAGNLTVDNSICEHHDVASNHTVSASCFLIASNPAASATLLFRGVTFQHNFVLGSGGVVTVLYACPVIIEDVSLLSCDAAVVGGGFYFVDTFLVSMRAVAMLGCSSSSCLAFATAVNVPGADTVHRQLDMVNISARDWHGSAASLVTSHVSLQLSQFSLSQWNTTRLFRSAVFVTNPFLWALTMIVTVANGTVDGLASSRSVFEFLVDNPTTAVITMHSVVFTNNLVRPKEEQFDAASLVLIACDDQCRFDVLECVFSGNSLVPQVVEVSGLYHYSGACIRAADHGELESDMTLTVNNTLFMNNIAPAGGAMAMKSSLLVFNSSFIDNRAVERNGGAILSLGCTLVLFESSDFYNNSAALSGGAVWLAATDNMVVHTFSLKNTSFSSNRALRNDGGGVAMLDAPVDSFCQLKILDCSFVRNEGGTEDVYGGALSVGGNFQTSIVRTNFVANVGGSGYRINGGAVASRSSPITLENCSFIGNVGGQRLLGGRGGAIFLSFRSSLFAVNCLFENNRAGSYSDTATAVKGAGGAIYMSGDAMTIRNSTFISNRAESGGALYIATGSDKVFIENSRFLRQSASLSGGVLFIEQFVTEIAVRSCVFDLNHGVSSSYGVASLNGGVIYNQSPFLELESCFFNSSFRVNNGGAIYTTVPIAIRDSYFLNNSAYLAGACVYYDATQPPSSTVGNFFVDHPHLLSLDSVASRYVGNTVLYGGGAVLFVGSAVPFNFTDRVTQWLLSSGRRLVALSPVLADAQNTALFGVGAASSSYQIVFTDSLFLPLTTFSVSPIPGVNFAFSLALLDVFGQQTASTLMDQTVYLYCVSNASAADDPLLLIDSTFILKDCFDSGVSRSATFQGKASVSVSFQFLRGSLPIWLVASTASSLSPYSPSGNSAVLFSAAPLSVTTKPCPPGYSVDTLACDSCPPSQYSIRYNSEKCYSCENLRVGRTADCSLTGNSVWSYMGYFAIPLKEGKISVFPCLVDYCRDADPSRSDVSTLSYDSFGNEFVPIVSSAVQPGEVRSQCKKGHTGFLCASCLPGYSLWGDSCADCEHPAEWIIAVFIFFVFVYVLIAHYVSQSGGTAFKIVVSFLQLGALLDVKDQLSPMSVSLFRFNTAGTCPFPRDERDIFWTDLAVVGCLYGALLILFAIAGITTAFKLHKRIPFAPVRMLFRLRAFQRSFLLLTLTAYGAISVEAIRFLQCVDYPTGDRVLAMYPGVSCRDSEYVDVFRVSVALAVLCGLIPIVFAAAVYLHFKRRLDGSKTRGQYVLGPLYESYTTSARLYEFVYLVRRPLLAAPTSFFWRIFIVVAYLALQHSVAPFRLHFHNNLESVALFGLLILVSLRSNGSPDFLFWAAFSFTLVIMAGIIAYEWYDERRQKKAIRESTLVTVSAPDPHERPVFSRRRRMQDADGNNSRAGDMELPLLKAETNI